MEQIISGLVVTVGAEDWPEVVEVVGVVVVVGAVVVVCAVAVEAFEVLVVVSYRNLDNLRAFPESVEAGWNSAPK